MQTLCDILERIERAARHDLLRVRPPGADAFETVSADEMLGRVERGAAGLHRLGVRRGDRVGLICGNRPAWHIVDFACHRLGAVVVPLFATLSPEQVAHCFGDSGCGLVVIEDEEQLAKVAGVSDRLPELRTVVAVEPELAAAGACGAAQMVTLAELLGTTPNGEMDLSGAGPDDLATIIYTSGTTGPPKGVMLSHDNLVSNAEALLVLQRVEVADVALSVLPLCHVYERTIDYLYLAAGAALAYSAPDRLSKDLQLIRPTVMIGVPRLYQKLREAVEARVEAAGAFDRRVYGLALEVGMRRARARLLDEPESVVNRLLHPLLEAAVLRKIRTAAGGRVRLFSAGGAAVDPDLAWWYSAVGWHLLQGYGLTESSPVVSGNSIGANRIGSVGRPLAGVEVRIADDGEILIRGPNVMLGYWGQPEATAEAVQDGWLRTGDVGRLDEDGFLWVTDRKKAILVTSTGKNVAPGPLQNALERSPYIRQAVVFGDGRRFISALIVPAFDRLEAWCGERGIVGSRDDLCREPLIEELIEAELERLQVDWAEYERVRAFRLLTQPFTVEGGQLTSTLKLVRHVVAAEHSDLIEDIYAG